VEIIQTEQQSVMILAITGDVDLGTSADLRRVIMGHIAAGQGVILDLSDVIYMDSSGIAALVEGYQNARRQSLGFGLATVSDGVGRVLKLARLDTVFALYDTVEEALMDLAS